MAEDDLIIEEKPISNPAFLALTENGLHGTIAAEIDKQILTAKAFPRSMSEFRKTALEMACLTPDISQSCIYTLPRDGKPIIGPSIRLAEIVFSAWKNIRAGMRVMGHDDKWVTAEGWAHDMEANVAVRFEVKRRITNKKGIKFSDDMITVTGNAAAAIAFRNAIYKVVPAALMQDIFETVRKTARGDEKTLKERREAAVVWFKGRGVTEKQLWDKLEIKGIEDIDLDILEIMTGFKNLLKNEEETVETLFGPKSTLTVQLTTEETSQRDAILAEMNVAAETGDVAKIKELFARNQKLHADKDFATRVGELIPLAQKNAQEAAQKQEVKAEVPPLPPGSPEPPATNEAPQAEAPADNKPGTEKKEKKK